MPLQSISSLNTINFNFSPLNSLSKLSPKARYGAAAVQGITALAALVFACSSFERFALKRWRRAYYSSNVIGTVEEHETRKENVTKAAKNARIKGYVSLFLAILATIGATATATATYMARR